MEKGANYQSTPEHDRYPVSDLTIRPRKKKFQILQVEEFTPLNRYVLFPAALRNSRTMDGQPGTPRTLQSRARAPEIGDLLGLSSGKGLLLHPGGDAVKENVKENAPRNVSSSRVRRGSTASEVSNISRTSPSAGSKYRSMPGSSNSAVAASRQLATAKRHEGFLERMQKLAPGFKLPDKPRSRSASSERSLPAADSVNFSSAAEKPAVPAPPWANNLVSAASAAFQIHADPLSTPRDWYSAPDRNPRGEELGAGAGTVGRVDSEQEAERARVEVELSAAAIQVDADLEESTGAQVRARGRVRGRGRGGEETCVLAGQTGAESRESAHPPALPRESPGATGLAGVSLEDGAIASAMERDIVPVPAGTMQHAARETRKEESPPPARDQAGMGDVRDGHGAPSPVRDEDAGEGDAMEAEMEAWARRQMRLREREREGGGDSAPDAEERQQPWREREAVSPVIALRERAGGGEEREAADTEAAGVETVKAAAEKEVVPPSLFHTRGF